MFFQKHRIQWYYFASLGGMVCIFSKIVDQVTASSVGPSVLFMLKAGEVVKTKEDRLWPSYKFIRKQDILAQVLFNLRVQELQGEEWSNFESHF